VDEDGEVGGSGRSVGLVGLVDISRDGSLEDAEAVELVDGAANLAQSFLKSVWTFLVVREDGVEDALEEASTRVLGLEDLDGRDCDGLGRVEADQLCLTLLCFGILPGETVVYLLLSLGVGLVLQQSEELRIALSVHCYIYVLVPTDSRRFPKNCLPLEPQQRSHGRCRKDSYYQSQMR
jgi:hypothetical protein